MIGRTLGHYRIVEEIGKGGMGVVYRAHDEHLNRDVALKVLPAGTLADEAARKRFRKEALALSKLNHPNIETVFDFDTQDGVDFLVMEHIPGVTLSDKLAPRRAGQAGPALAEKEVVRLGLQLAEGLAAAHEQGVIHRDLKPGNLRVTPDGRLKILDFGLAKLIRPMVGPEFSRGTATTESLTETEGRAGTPLYMAPEQHRGEKADARTDIYATGLVFLQMATGELPRVRGRALGGKLSAGLEQIVTKCLEDDPELRYQSAKELLVDFRRLGSAPVAILPRPIIQAEGVSITKQGGSLVIDVEDREEPVHVSVPLWVAVGVPAAMALAVLLGLLLVLNPGGLRERLFGAGSPTIDSIAVLPLENLSGDPEQEYFADGMTEALIADLSKIEALKVISRTSVMQYKGTKKPLPEIARELDVDAVIEGSVLREGDRVRVTVQLLDARADRHLWAERYERDLTSVLALQSDVARAIANEVEVKLTPEEQGRLAGARPVNREAYEAYLKGLYHFTKIPEGFKSLEYFRQAIDIDPTYAPAYVGLADSYNRLAINGERPPREVYPMAKAALVKALELDETLAEAHALLGIVKFRFDWEWDGAERELKRALQLEPNSARAHLGYGAYCRVMGRLEEHVAHLTRYRELDPLSPSANLYLARALYRARRYDEAVAQVHRTLELLPDSAYAYVDLASNYAAKKMYTEAIAACEKASGLMPEDDVVLSGCGRVYGLSGRHRDAGRAFEKLTSLSARRYVDPYIVAALAAVIYRDPGERDRIFDWLERAYEGRSANLCLLKIEPAFDSLRSDARFQALLRRMNFPSP